MRFSNVRLDINSPSRAAITGTRNSDHLIYRRTGEKCLESGFYDPEHRYAQKVNLMIFKGEKFPTYDGDAETVWVQARPLFSQCQILHAQSVLRESVIRNCTSVPGSQFGHFGI